MDYKTIYQTEAARYDQLISREDYRGNILPALEAIRPLAGLEVVELGAGTGRLTRLLAPQAKRILATDISSPMLKVARQRLAAENFLAAAAENSRIPAGGRSADLVIAGWSLGHLTGWFPDDWPRRVDQVVYEMQRLLRPDGAIIILETLGTGREDPQPPNEALADYYARLEAVHGFQKSWIRTDYQFESVAEAEVLCRFFFGAALADRVRQDKITLLPECTGIWTRT